MYSTPTPKWTSTTEFGNGKLNTILTLCNDSYFYLSLDEPLFGKDFMNGVRNKPALVGVNIGGDGSTPTKTYLYKIKP